MTIAPASPTLHVLTDDQKALLVQMQGRLTAVAAPNSEASKRYSGEWVAQQYGFSIPPKMQSLHTVAGWCGTVVDVLEERLDWEGWRTTDGVNTLGLDEVYAANELDVDSGLGHLDSLIFGVSFVSVGTGMDDEPPILITPHSPMSMTGAWSNRRRRLEAALAADVKDGQLVQATLYLPDETITVGADLRVTNRDEHHLGRVPVVMVPNRVRGSRQVGRSEISLAVRYYSDAAARTLLGLEVNREFYNAPQRVGLNVDDSMFEDESGNKISPWQSIMGRVWNVPPNGDGEPEPKVVQLDPSSPAPYIDQVTGYATLLAAEAGIPASYLGFQTDNPASADAIRAGEARLVKRAQRRQKSFGRAWHEVGRLALLVRDGRVPDGYDTRVYEKWVDAATPTRAAAADEATKLVSVGVLPPESSVTMDRIGLTPDEQAVLVSDRRRAAGRQIVASLGAQAAQGAVGA